MRMVRMPEVERILAVDVDSEIVRRLGIRLSAEAPGVDCQVEAINASFCARDPRFRGFDAVIMAESIEHVDAERLSQIENAIFAFARPPAVLITTPNSEYNPMLRMGRRKFRHPDHKFEWDRGKFKSWSEGVARRQGFGVEVFGIGWDHPALGAATQAAEFRKRAAGCA